ncbi:DNA-binding response regulator [Minicystis rosea]|nr:DNA-binding response regulator [Minicystis rosea]
MLVVGDDREIRHSLQNLLLCEDYDVHLALSGGEALRVLDRQRIDAAVIDLMMPRLDGVGACHALLRRPERERPPVVFVISPHGELRRHLGSACVRRVFPKPFDPRELVDELTRHIFAVTSRRSA